MRLRSSHGLEGLASSWVGQRSAGGLAQTGSRSGKQKLEDLLRRDAETAADGSIDILSELAAVQGGDAAVEERPQSGVDES